MRHEGMQTTLTCSAQSFGQLGPFLLRSVTAPSEFERGTQFAEERRVQILRAGADCIAAAVAEDHDRFEQTLQLQNRQLLAACSCAAEGRLLCRHCVAVLLGVYRWKNHLDGDEPEALTAVDREPIPPAAPEEPPCPASVTVPSQDLARFLHWVQHTVVALRAGDAMPVAPPLPSEPVRSWVHMLRQLEVCGRPNETQQTALLHAFRDEVSHLHQVITRYSGTLTGTLSDSPAIGSDVAQSPGQASDRRDDLPPPPSF
ncbi:MAG: hypothetical protein ACREI3_07835 [Nitrospirales bacterium]